MRHGQADRNAEVHDFGKIHTQSYGQGNRNGNGHSCSFRIANGSTLQSR